MPLPETLLREILPGAVAELVARGLAVFPIPAGQRQAPKAWHTLVSRHPQQVWPAGSNIGIGCRASNIVVVDLDRKHGNDGITAFQRLCVTADVSWPHTFTVATPGNGLHLYFAAPADRTVASTIGHPAPGIDIRAPGWTLGGYVIGPGSTVNGRTYRISDPHPITALPAWLGALLRPARPPTSRQPQPEIATTAIPLS